MEPITIEEVRTTYKGLCMDVSYESVKGDCNLGYFETPQEAFLEALDHDCGRDLVRQR